MKRTRIGNEVEMTEVAKNPDALPEEPSGSPVESGSADLVSALETPAVEASAAPVPAVPVSAQENSAPEEPVPTGPNEAEAGQILEAAAEVAEAASTGSPAAARPEDDGRAHVLYLNHSAQMSGAEASLRSLLWQFRRSDAPVDPVLGLPGGGDFADLMRDEGFNITLAPLRRLHRPRGLVDSMTSLVHVLQTTPFICRLVDQTHSDLVHSNSTTAHLVGGLAAERTGRPAIWHVRDLVALGKLGPQLAARSARIVAISACVAEQLQKDGVPAEKITLIHNGLDPDEWRVRERSHLRESLGIPDDAFLFGVVGQLVPWKNHAAFIAAAAALVKDEGCANARFAIVGGDLWGEQQPYVKELRRMVKENDLIERFNFIPHQTDGVDAMSALDCLVHPALDEPFGRVVLEAMALRKPVIAMAANGPLEIVTNGHDGILVAPDAENGLTVEMKRILADQALREELTSHSRATVEEKFHIALSAQKILALYDEILG